jgi:hypothetical protein
MIKATIDRPKLEKSLKRFAKDFGDTNAQALCRWGVQACRELAGSSQVFGTGTAAKKKQWGSIEAGMNNVLITVPKSDRRKTRFLQSAQEAHDFINSNQDSKGRTKKLPIEQRAFISDALFKKVLKERQKLAGMAKGGWIGAGQAIAAAQKGTDRISIGKNFLGYTQKHSKFGSARKPVSGWKPTAELSNRVRHSGASNVLSPSDSKKAMDWSLKKTVKWYASALRRQNQKQKA